MKRSAILLACCLFAGLLAGCAGAATASAPQATVAGVTVVHETGLLEAEELPTDTFAFEIMPEADDAICEMQIQYYGGSGREFLGQLVLEPETDSFFTREDTFRRGFTVTDRQLLKNFTLSFVFIDENGTERQARNDYTVDADYGMFYFIKISGSREDGYTLADR